MAGITDLAVADGGTGASTAAARANLGLDKFASTQQTLGTKSVVAHGLGAAPTGLIAGHLVCTSIAQGWAVNTRLEYPSWGLGISGIATGEGIIVQVDCHQPHDLLACDGDLHPHQHGLCRRVCAYGSDEMEVCCEGWRMTQRFLIDENGNYLGISNYLALGRETPVGPQYAGQKWDEANEVWLPPEPVIPKSVTARQFKLQLVATNLVDAWVSTQDRATQWLINTAGTFVCTAPMMQVDFEAMGFQRHTSTPSSWRPPSSAPSRCFLKIDSSSYDPGRDPGDNQTGE